MTNWRPDFDPSHLYFITTKAVDHAKIFKRDVMKRLLIDTLDCFRLRKSLILHVFVIMPNHIHLIVRCPPDNPVADLIRDYKKQTADRIIRHYQAEDNHKVLDILSSKAEKSDKQNYKVWEDGYNAKDIVSPKFLRQKTEYIHNNPCQPHWNLATDPTKYMWSSARFYLAGKPALIPVEDAKKLMV